MLNTQKTVKPNKPTKPTKSKREANQKYYQMDLFSDFNSELQASTHDQELQYELKGMFSTGQQPKHYED